ncbi:MAG: ATP-dependent endonuclease [Nitrososphaerota archaeon]|nr:ATP-dependent endonuclease [Nitrososphaerota archaeon]
MKITKVVIENYKGLRKIEFPLSDFVCFIGENNAGKSSVLQAISLFLTGTSLPKTHFFDPSNNIRVLLELKEITEDDINRLAEEHRQRIKGIVSEGTLTLVRVWGTEGKSTLRYMKMVPKDPRFLDDQIAALLKGKKAGSAFAKEVVDRFPELDGKLTNQMNQANVRQEIDELANSMPTEQKESTECSLPTGIPESISALLPDPIYIQAVKDLRDDVKTTESTPFGKVLGILLKVIEPLLAEEKSLFDKLNSKLNRVKSDDGTETDNRLLPVKTIERTVEKYVNESFKSVKLRIKIPPPELKTVLSSALIYADDGIDGLIDTKGDGLRRAIVFAILRTYVEFSKSGMIDTPELNPSEGSHYILLFEEPELFLHPKAQQILFEALGIFSKSHPVIVTTHSPLFLGPESTNTFVKIRKTSDAAVSVVPFAQVHPIDLTDTSTRDQFQLICFENNNIAFFADAVILVEGDSDYIVLPHIAKLLKSDWDISQHPIRYARIGGKGNIKRYKDFFNKFGMRVFVITDLDLVLGKEFAQIDPSDALKKQREELIKEIDSHCSSSGAAVAVRSKDIQKAQEDGGIKARWEKVKDLTAQFKSGEIKWDAVANAIDEFFSWEKYWIRKDILKSPPNAKIRSMKEGLLQTLRGDGIIVLEKGVIEDYYPETITHDSKPAMAQSFCKEVTTKEQALKLSTSGHKNLSNADVTEFEAIFDTIFSN